MARKVFFSFHYEHDVWRVANVRNSDQFKAAGESTAFIDGVAWEAVKKGGSQAIKNWINKQLEGTSVTIVLIGSETNGRDYVHYEIEQSIKKGNGLLGVYVHNMKDSQGKTVMKGTNPFLRHQVQGVFGALKVYPTYDWVNDNGRDNLKHWIESVAPRSKTSGSLGSLLGGNF